MFDPVTISAAVATASTAFNGIKRAFQAGRDLVDAYSEDVGDKKYFLNPHLGWAAMVAAMHEVAS